jgi:hypothetical protein
LDEGFGPFSVPFKAMFNPGTTLLCAYSLWSYDTAVSAEFRFTTTATGSGSPSSSSPSGSGSGSSAYAQAIAKCDKLSGGNKRKCVTRAKLARALAACKAAGGSKSALAKCKAKARRRYR